MSAQACQRAGLVLRDRASGSCEVQEGILVEVFAGDEGLEVGFVACGCCERGVRGTQAWRWGVADCDVVVVPEGEHYLLLDGLGWHVGRGGKACSAWWVFGFELLDRTRSLFLD